MLDKSRIFFYNQSNRSFIGQKRMEKEKSRMATSRDPRKQEQPNTYLGQNQPVKDELYRLTLQSNLITTSMGGPLADLPDAQTFRHVLDIGCGSGSWVIETAEKYPAISLVGIDINQRMVDYARSQAIAHQVNERVDFQRMDALLALGFPSESFDLVHLRLGLSFLRTWDWPQLLIEILRVTRPGGMMRITDTEIIQPSTSPAHLQLTEMSLCALFRAGHLFTQETKGLTAHLASLLTRYGYRQVQTKNYALEYRAGTIEGQAFYEDMKHVFYLLHPFYQKWGCAPVDYEAIYQQALNEMQLLDFRTTWNLLSAWGIKP